MALDRKIVRRSLFYELALRYMYMYGECISNLYYTESYDKYLYMKGMLLVGSLLVRRIRRVSMQVQLKLSILPINMAVATMR